MVLENKKILVCGMARSGISAALLLKEKGNFVTIQDLKPKDKINEADLLLIEKNKIETYFGKNPDEIILNFDLLVLSPGIPTYLEFIKKAKNNNITVVSEIEVGYSFCKGKIIGITGTNGKTTTTSIVGEVLKKYDKNTKVVGNIGVSFTSEVKNIKENDFVVIELSSFQLETIKDFTPNVSCVLNITPDHLDVHKTMENYISCKENIFKNQKQNNFTILNHDDEICKKMKDKTNSKIIFFSIKDILKEGIFLENDNIVLNCFGLKEVFLNIYDLKLLGLHNVQNVMAAIGICLACGVEKELMKDVIKNFNAVPHRIEFVKTINGIDFYNDSKGTNPDAVIKSIEAMRKPTILILGGYDKNSDFNELINNFNGKIKYVFIIGNVKEKIKNALVKNNFNNFSIAESLKDAVFQAFNKAENDNCVLLSPACASWDSFNNFEERGDYFKKFVNEISNTNN